MVNERVRGRAGVFYADRDAEGVVLRLIAPPSGERLAEVRLDDGDLAVVPVVELEVL